MVAPAGSASSPRPSLSSEIARHYALEAFAGYAGERAEHWMTTRSTVAKMVELHRANPAELHRGLQTVQRLHEDHIGMPGKLFGYAQVPGREGGGVWDAGFPFPQGPFRAQLDAATGIPGTFEQAFPEYARLMAATAPHAGVTP